MCHRLLTHSKVGLSLDDEQSHLTRYLVGCCMKSGLEDGHDGHVEEEQDSRVDVHRPIMAGVQVEVKGRRAVSWDDDVLQSKESKQEQIEGWSQGQVIDD